MTNTTADITVSHTHNTTTYESKEFGIILAAVDRLGDYSWRSTCYFTDEEYDEERHGSRAAAEAVALSHTTAVIDAL
jgi:hypothetical protein